MNVTPRDRGRSQWTILEEVERRNGRRRVLAECSCGTIREVDRDNVTSGASLSCGCMKQHLGKRRASHDERFWQKVDRRGDDECWPWLGSVEPTYGYGLFHADDRSYGAHRWMYLSAHGSIADGLVVDHTCHNRDLTCAGGPSCAHRRCVNPAHLDAVTSVENTLRGVLGRRRAAS